MLDIFIFTNFINFIYCLYSNLFKFKLILFFLYKIVNDSLIDISDLFSFSSNFFILLGKLYPGILTNPDLNIPKLIKILFVGPEHFIGNPNTRGPFIMIIKPSRELIFPFPPLPPQITIGIHLTFVPIDTDPQGTFLGL